MSTCTVGDWNGPESIYQVQSRKLVQDAHPGWSAAQIEAEAKRSFEAGAKALHLATLARSKAVRPHGLWGW